MVAQIYVKEGKPQALAAWQRWRAKPGWLTRRPGEKRNPMGWMPLARRRLEPIAPCTSSAEGN